MNNKLIITKHNNKIISSLFEENDLVQINVEDENKESILGNIYVGKVKNIVKNIGAAFVEIQKGVMCYYSLEENKNPIYARCQREGKITIGDEIIVQVSKENIKTKAPAVTCNINITGKYVVLTHGKTLLAISNKISEEAERIRLKNILKQVNRENYGFIIRTNSINKEEQIILDEVEQLENIYQKIREFGIHRTPFSLIYKTPANYICDIRDGFADQIDEYITDDFDLYHDIKEYLTNFQKEDILKLRFYDDKMIRLNNLYSITYKLEHALNEKIWLKSGGSIIIQPTEALVVIDVNTAKAVNGKKRIEETFLKINLEAAKEIVKQIRLRNLSGIIIIDFIDMSTKESKEILLQELRTLIKKDPIKTTLVDMTALNLVELTRKKVRKPLYEQFSFPCSYCGGTGRVDVFKK